MILLLRSMLHIEDLMQGRRLRLCSPKTGSSGTTPCPLDHFGLVLIAFTITVDMTVVVQGGASGMVVVLRVVRVSTLAGGVVVVTKTPAVLPEARSVLITLSPLQYARSVCFGVPLGQGALPP